MTTYGNRIDKVGNMIWSQFSTKVLQINLLDIDDWDRIRVKQYSKENLSWEQNSSLYNQIYTWYYQSKIYNSKRKERRIFNFLKNDKKI